MAGSTGFSGRPNYAPLQFIMPIMPFATMTLGLVGDIIMLAEYASGGENTFKEFVAVLIFLLLPIVALFIATLAGIEKAEDEDPEIVKNSCLVRALYFAFHVKIYHIYFASIGLGALGLCGCAPSDAAVVNPPRISRAARIRRWVTFLNNAPIAVCHMFVLLSRVAANGGELGTDTNNLQFAVSTAMFAIGCTMAQHHKSDKTKPYDAVYTAPKRFVATAVVFAYKVLFTLSRTLTFAFFLYVFGRYLFIPVILHGIVILIVFCVLAKPAITDAYTFLRALILSYTQFFDINDVWVNELNGKLIVSVTYYIVFLVYTLALLIPAYVESTASDRFNITCLITPLGAIVVGVLCRLLYYLTPLFPKDEVVQVVSARNSEPAA